MQITTSIQVQNGAAQGPGEDGEDISFARSPYESIDFLWVFQLPPASQRLVSWFSASAVYLRLGSWKPPSCVEKGQYANQLILSPDLTGCSTNDVIGHVNKGDWIPPEHRHRSFLFHPTLGADIKNSEDLGLVSVSEDNSTKVVRVTHSTVVEMAKPAECRVRPEVVEITRSMVDPTRVNFYLWPSCVEVQRCSGCCNSRIYKCQPTQVQERRVKVRKQVYRRKGSVIKMVEVVLLDHLACKCMNADSQGSLVSPAPIIVPARKYSSRKRKHQMSKHVAGEKGFRQT